MTNTTNGILSIDYPVTFEPVRYAKTGKAYAFRVVTPGWAVQISSRRADGSRDYFKTTRAYGAHSAFVPGFDAEETRLFKAITDHDVKDPALAKFQRASTRTANARLAVVLPELVRILVAYGFEVLTIGGSDLSAKFSRNAGCGSCPCSPGHVVDSRIVVNGRPVDLWFDEAVPPVVLAEGEVEQDVFN